MLGMHRGGTSATAGALARLGLSPGDPSTLKGPSPVNPAGFWEQPPLTRLNDRILEHLGSAWDAPPPLVRPLPVAPSHLSELELGDAFARVFTASPWVWKDPRACITLPLWMDTGALDPVVVLVLRNPLDVAASLAARDGATPPFALALWERSMRFALASARGLPTIVTEYSELLADPVEWAGRIAGALGGFGLSSHGASPRMVAEFVDPDLRHHESPRARLDREPWISHEQRELADALEAVRGTHASLDPGPLPPETDHTEWLLAERRRAVAEQRRLRAQLRSPKTGRRGTSAGQPKAEPADDAPPAPPGGSRSPFRVRRRRIR